MESDQPSIRDADKVVLFWMNKTERIGFQSNRNVYDKETDTIKDIDYFIEQQTWNIKVICIRSTAPISDDNIPLTSEDVASMLIGWFNRMGCNEFRKHNMANLFIQLKDVKTYKDKSDVNQWTTEFPIKIQVIKQFEMDIDWATAKYGGSVGVQGDPLPLINNILD